MNTRNTTLHLSTRGKVGKALFVLKVLCRKETTDIIDYLSFCGEASALDIMVGCELSSASTEDCIEQMLSAGLLREYSDLYGVRYRLNQRKLKRIANL